MKKKILCAAAGLLLSGLIFADGPKNYGGGKPWINSLIKENIMKAQRTSPKEDFQLYVNYDWLQKTEIPEGEKNYSSFAEVADAIQKNILEVLTNQNIPGIDAENVRTLYHAILDWDARNAVGLKPVEDIISQIKGITTIDQLSDFITDPDKTFLVNQFFSVFNQPRYDDSTSYITSIAYDSFILDDAAEYKKRTEIGDRYYQAYLYRTKALFARLGYSEAQAEKMLDDTLKLEAILAKKSYTNAEENSPYFIKKVMNIYSPEKTFALCKNYPLKRFIERAGYGNANEFMIVCPKNLAEVDKIYKKENLEQIKTLLIVKAVNHYSHILDKEAYEISLNAENMINGSSGRIPDQKMAVEAVQNMLNTPLNRAYLARYDLSKLREDITGICKNLISIYRNMLEEEDWLSEATRAKAIEKLDNMRINAVYPDKWIDYSGLKLKGLSFLDCMKAIDAYNRKLMQSHTNGKVDKELWSGEELLIANAYYMPPENSINIIPGLLDKPFYYEGMSQEALLGGIGCVIGHEISHAFDTQGAQFDKDGNMNNWWTKADYAAFQKRASKLIAYYDSITIWEGLQAQGTLVQTEAIADMAGVKAILKYAENLPNFNYKEFFEAFATVWRRIMTPEADYWYTFNDVHPKACLRTNVTVQQFEEFYKTYDVKPGDNMYLAPEDRILVW